MKKMVLLLAVALLTGSMVWAQTGTGTATPYPEPSPSPFPRSNANVFLNGVGFISSVESQNAPGFLTMVDDYMDPTSFDPEIGTFLLLGGVSNIQPGDGDISIGLAKTLGPYYVAGYYKGSILGTSGGTWSTEGVTSSNPDDNNKTYKYSKITWNNNLALLFGVAGMGFRLDYSDGGGDREETSKTYDGKYTNDTNISNTPGPELALSWGAGFGDLYPWAKLSFKFPDVQTVGGIDLTDIDDIDNYGKKATYSSKSAFNIEAGVFYDLSDGNFTDTVTGILTFGTQFKDSYKGDKEVITQFSDYNDNLADGKEYDYGGAWGLDLYLNYRKTFELGKVTLKITPNLWMRVISESDDYSIADKKNPSPTWFTLEPGVQLGVKYQAFEKLAFFTGLDLTLLSWNTYATPGGDLEPIDYDSAKPWSKPKDDTSKWYIDGISWNNKGNVNNFMLGMAWTPVKGLVVSADIKSTLNAFVKLDMQNMTVNKGTLFDDTSSVNIGDWLMVSLGKIFGTFRLTVTYTYNSSGSQQSAVQQPGSQQPAAQQPAAQQPGNEPSKQPGE